MGKTARKSISARCRACPNHTLRHRVLNYPLRIPRGRVTTYGQIAAALGDPHMARAVGSALHANPNGELYPCYKVVHSDGRLSEAYAFGGAEAQAARLEAEGIEVLNGRVDLKKYGYRRWER